MYLVTSYAGLVEKLEVTKIFGNSDYSIITWILICKVGKSKKRIRQHLKAAYNSAGMWLGKVDWNQEFKSVDISGKWQQFCGILNKAVERFVPLGCTESEKFSK